MNIQGLSGTAEFAAQQRPIRGYACVTSSYPEVMRVAKNRVGRSEEEHFQTPTLYAA